MCLKGKEEEACRRASIDINNATFKILKRIHLQLFVSDKMHCSHVFVYTKTPQVNFNFARSIALYVTVFIELARMLACL